MFEDLGNDSAKVLPELKTAVDKILTLAEENEDLKKGLNQVKVNGFTLNDMLTDLSKNGEISKDKAEQYNLIMNALYSQLVNGDYDPKRLAESIMEIASNSS